MLRKLRAISFEINDICPLEKLHPECPRNADRRWRGLDTDSILSIVDMADFAKYCRDVHGFKGFIQVHYYNEPLATRRRIEHLMHFLPGFRFSLWTNGVYLTNDDLTNGFLDKFDHVMLTMYYINPVAAKFNILLKQRYPHIEIQQGRLDARKEDVTPVFNPDLTRCDRLPWWELNFDYYGNGHACCGDWRGEMNIGNLRTHSHDQIIEKWRDAIDLIPPEWDEEMFLLMPTVCQKCTTRTPDMCRLGERRIV